MRSLTDRQRRAMFAKGAAKKGLVAGPRRLRKKVAVLPKAPRRRGGLAGEALLAKHEGLVKRVAGQFHRRFPNAPLDDLLQEGRIGLLRAGKLYKQRPGASFATYAHHHIAKRIRDAAASANTVRVPFRAHKKGVRAIIDAPGAQALAEFGGGDDGGIGRAHAKATLSRILKKLPAAERDVLELRKAGLTHREVAKRLKKSASSIHALERAAFVRLRRRSLRKGK